MEKNDIEKIMEELGSATNTRFKGSYSNSIMRKVNEARESGILLKNYSDIQISEFITEAIHNKSTIYIDDTKTIHAIVDETAIPISEKMKSDVEDATMKYLAQFVKSSREKGYDRKKIAGALYEFDCLYAAYYLDSKKIEEVNDLLNESLAIGILNGEEETQKTIILGIIDFLELSKERLPKERRFFNSVNGYLDNVKETAVLRQMYISNLLEAKIVNYNFLAQFGVIEDLPLEVLERIYISRGLITDNSEIEDAYIRSGSFKNRGEILDYLYEKNKSLFSDFVTSAELIHFAANGKLKTREIVSKLDLDEMLKFNYPLLEKTFNIDNFPKNTRFIEFREENGKHERYIAGDFLSRLPRETFMQLVLSKNIKYKIPFKSMDYIELFGKLNSDDILLLQKNGLVESQDFIKLMDRTNSVEFMEFVRTINNVFDFYNADRLEEIINSGKFNGKFVELYTRLTSEYLMDQGKQEYFGKLINELGDKENGAELVTTLAIKGIQLPPNLGYSLEADQVYNMYIEEKITEADILKLYQSHLIEVDMLRDFFTSEQLGQYYQEGKLPADVINILDNRADFAKWQLIYGNLSFPQVLRLYSAKDGIDINEFETIINGYPIEEEELSQYLSDEITPEKVEALFANCYISHDDLSALVARGIITEEQAKHYADELSSNSKYEALFTGENGVVELTTSIMPGEPETDTGIKRKRKDIISRASKVKNDPELQQMLLEEIGFDNRVLILKGENNSLAGYKVYPSKEYKTMVFINEENVGNATYVMSLEQGMYLLRNIVRNDKLAIQSGVTKGTLRETEHVKVKNAARGWGANVVDAIRQLSPAFKEKLKSDDTYAKHINEIVEEIKNDYDKRRE